MSVEAPKPAEQATPVETKAVEQPTQTPAVATESAAVTDAPKVDAGDSSASAVGPAATDAAATEAATKPTEEVTKKEEPAVEIVPATEGTLGYKAPGFLK
jgi:hypothetical protein